MGVSKKKSIVSVGFMIVISCITQITTIMKTSIVAGTFGATEAMDAYYFANNVLSFIFGLLASGIPTVILPAYVKKEDRNGIDSFITILYAGLIGILALMLVLRYQIVGLFTNRSEMFVNIACNVLLILSFGQLLSTICNITTAYFQNIEKFNIPKVVQLFSHLIVLVCLVVIKDLTIYQYTWIIAGGFAFSFIVDLLVAMRYGFRYRPAFAWDHEVTQRLLSGLIPIIFSSGVYRLSLFVDTLIASNLEVGSVTILNYAGQIPTMVNSIVAGNLLIYAYPKIIRKIQGGQGQAFFWEQSNRLHWVICLMVAGFVAVGKEGIALLFQRGLFDSQLTNAVFLGSLIYIAGQPVNIVRDLMYRYFYAIGDTKTPASNSVIVSISHLIFSILLVWLMGFYGIIIGTVLASLLSTARMFTAFRKKITFQIKFRHIMTSYLKNYLVLAVTVVVTLLTKHYLPVENAIPAILLYGTEVVACYLLVSMAINRKNIFSKGSDF